MKIDQLLQLLSLCKENEEEKSEIFDNQGLIKIVILQRGWVVIGKFYQKGTKCWVEDGYVIRRWGTTKGLGQLAIEGKQEETILDPIPKTDFHELTIVACMLCDQTKWK
jgi:hypothetical protein